MSNKVTGFLAGALFLLPGLLLPSATLVEWLHGPPGDLREHLLLGATLFRATLVVTGLYLVALFYLPVAAGNAVAAPAPVREGRAGLLVLAGIALLALLARLYRLDEGIWLDEIFAYVHYVSRPAGAIFTTFDDPNNHLLYTLSASLAVDWFGEGTWSLRLPAALFGVGSVLAMYFFARQVCGQREALFSAALLAFAYHHIWFSQNGRGYTALLFFALLSSAFLVRSMRDGSLHGWLLYALTAALGVMTHLTMGFVILAQLVVYFTPILTGRSTQQGAARWTGFFAGFVTGGLLSILAYAFVLPQMFDGGLVSGTEGTVEEWTNPVWMVLEVMRALQLGFAGGVMTLVAITVFSLGLIDYLRRQPVVAVLFLVSCLSAFLLMISINYTLFPRFFFYAMGFAVMIVVRGAMVTGNGMGRLLRLPQAANGWPGVAACSVMVLVALLSMPRAYGPKQDYAGALEYIDAQRQAGDAVVTVGTAGYPYETFYTTDWTPVATPEELAAVRAGSTRTWVVYTMPLHTEAAYPEIFRRLARDYDEVVRFGGTLNGGDVVVCRSRS